MGAFSLVISGIGKSGCNRKAKDGDSIKYDHCNKMDCPDCLARFATFMFKNAGFDNVNATLTHWIGDVGFERVDDDMIALTRRGSFPE